MPSTLTYHARVFSMSAVCSRKCSMWLRGMAGTSLGLLQSDQLHQARELGVLFRDQPAEFVCRQERRAHRVFFAAAREFQALDCTPDGVLEHGDDADRRA